MQQLIIARELLKEVNGMSEPSDDSKLLLPEGWPRPKGYANGVAARGRQVFIAGMIGWDAQGVFHSDDFAAQARQALAEHRRRAARGRRASPSTSCA